MEIINFHIYWAGCLVHDFSLSLYLFLSGWLVCDPGQSGFVGTAIHQFTLLSITDLLTLLPLP
jgi:hypothetical protein